MGEPRVWDPGVSRIADNLLTHPASIEYYEGGARAAGVRFILFDLFDPFGLINEQILTPVLLRQKAPGRVRASRSDHRLHLRKHPRSADDATPRDLGTG